MTIIRSEEELRALYGQPKPTPVKKVIDHVDDYCRRFIELSPFLVLSTSGKDGLVDISPRGDAPGFVTLEDEKSLLIPDRRGNNRIDTLSNVIDNPAVGVLFLVPGVDETLRVQGTAEIETDSEICKQFRVMMRAPKTVLRVKVKEVYFQCAKALMRSKLWTSDYAIERSSFPAMGEIMKAHTQLDGPAETRDEMLERYKDMMY